ncbi:hypothetical protein FOL75_26540 [Bacillus thuringiensis]|uniref:hypothetical protein n=1 Tax=Bacillus cereus group TaxID=86661 RepID=UPI001C03875E|nr:MULTISPECIES: hypothetical protein [Bacillus cereus group]MDR5025352.1 hypothetical protein [Bacillus thuringiensis]QWI47388.1 hypothetical protein EXW55_31745 [Bacillus mycoides]
MIVPEPLGVVYTVEKNSFYQIFTLFIKMDNHETNVFVMLVKEAIMELCIWQNGEKNKSKEKFTLRNMN